MSSCADSPRVAVLASGRGSNFEALAGEFRKGTIPGRIVLLITDNPQAKALQVAERFDIPAVCLPFDKRNRDRFDRALLDTLGEHSIDYVFLAGFMRILGKPVVEAYRGRILNIHPSLLPACPGLRAQAQALAAGAKVSGCTVHFADAGVDTGPIILQRRVPVLPNDDEDTLSARILEQEHLAYPEAARLVLSGQVCLDGGNVSRQSAAPPSEDKEHS
jgi:phosphoribosylglycinamide formyltransferase-1